MNANIIKMSVQNYQWATIDDIEEILQFIAKKRMIDMELDIVFAIEYDEGGRLKSERTPDGKLQVEIGILPFYNVRENKGLNSVDERKEFIELILQTFHELQHVNQINNIIDNPTLNEETFRITRELIINDFFLGFTNYNYELTVSEIDALRTSLLETIKFFEYMESDITPEEVFATMKEKELCYLNYNLENFGNTYKTAIDYFNQICYHPTDIKGYEKIIENLPEDLKRRFDDKCFDLQVLYNLETNIEKKLDILMEMALIMMPELYDKYPLSKYKNNKRR